MACPYEDSFTASERGDGLEEGPLDIHTVFCQAARVCTFQ
jgi:hypothetical protein